MNDCSPRKPKKLKKPPKILSTFIFHQKAIFCTCRLTTYLDSNRVFTWLSYFGYTHGELESQLSTAVTGIRYGH